MLRRIHRLLIFALLLLGTAAVHAQIQPQEPPVHPNRHWEYPDIPFVRRIREADPNAFRFRRAHYSVTERARTVREAIAMGQMTTEAAEEMGMETAVTGTFNYPVLVGAFTPLNFDTTMVLSELQDRLFGTGYTGGGHTGSLNDYYQEVSYGRVGITGKVYGYAQVDSSVDYYRDIEGDNRGFGEHMGDWIREVIEILDPIVDFSQYDVDPVDGYVDILMLAHNMIGFERSSVATSLKGFWSHKWSYESASGTGQPYYTDDEDPSHPGRYIRISDYMMQPLRSSPVAMIEMGVFAHELGHGFGLPDMYDTDEENSGGDSEGLGHWALMSAGNWRSPSSPAHMSAWSKIRLGWVEPLAVTDTDMAGLEIPNVNQNEFIVKVHTSQMGSEEYFLIENRQRIGFDRDIWGTGLLIYHIDDDVTTGNRNPSDMRWSLEQADGLFQLEKDPDNPLSNRGDAGDPWPGSFNNTHFWLESVPSSETRAYQDSYLDLQILTPSHDTMMVDLFATRSFNLSAPADGGYVSDLTPLLSWESYTPGVAWGAVSYQVQLDTSAVFYTAMLDTTGTNSLEWTLTLVESIPYYWRVIAFDDMGHSRINRGGSSTFILDVTPPSLTLGALRNPVLRNNIDILLVSDEPLQDYSVTTGGNQLSTQQVSASNAFILRADYSLVGPGTVPVHAEGSDLAGNSSTSDAELTAAITNAGQSTEFTSADGMLSVLIPAGTVGRGGYAVILQQEEGTAISTQRVAGTPPSEIPEGTALSPFYWVDIPDLIPGRKIEVKVEWAPGALGHGRMPSLWRLEGEKWVPLETSVDLSNYTASIRIEKTGLFQLRDISGSNETGGNGLTLEPAYPNPFNPTTTIAFALPSPGSIRLSVVNTRGQTVSVLADGSYPAGRHIVTWNGRDQDGNPVASGIYLYILETPSGRRSRKMTLIR